MKSRNSYELKLMKRSGQIAVTALKKSIDLVKADVSGLELDKIAEEEIYRLGGGLSYKTVQSYNFATCVTINEQVVHGIPTDRKIKNGDLVSVDLAVEYKGWHTDCAWTTLVRDQGADDSEWKGKKRFLEVGEQALWDGIAQAVDGNRIGDISNAIQTKVEGGGYSVVRSLVGHGVGRKLHEDPEIPGYGQKNTGMQLKAGMTLAIEVIYAMGKYDVVLEPDGWTYSTADKSLSGLFEMTVVVGKKQAEVLTRF